MGTVTLDRQALPILHTSDAVVIGGSLAGVAAALTLARAGRRVALVESRTYLGREITATLRPWIPLPAGADPSALPEVVSACIEASRTAPRAGEFPLHPDAVKIRLEDLLLDAGVKLLYASTPVGLCAEGDSLQGVVIGNKSGRQVLVCRLLVSASLGTALARLLDAHWELAAAPARALPPSAAQEAWPPASPSQGLRVAEPASPQRGRPYPLHPVRPAQVPVLCDVDVLVVGGGTSGAVAAVVAARQGMRTCIVEMNPGLGGTGTYGGVDSYWCGNRRGFVAGVVHWVNQAHDYLSQPRPDDLDWPRWNVEAKTHAWLHEAQDAGVELLLNAPAIGAVVQGNAVRGVVVATRAGPAALLGRVVVDATGDGDVAACAGAATTYGSTRDHAVMWYSLPQVATPGRTWNNFTSMVDVSNVEDTTRAILAGRRQGACHDHGLYVAPRESRHVWGDAVLTLTDQLLQRCWPDVVTVAFSNNDIKGQISSDWMRCGLIPPHLEIEIPYRALLPGGLENILVVGKALSALRDALSAIRMQPDLENLGGVAGLAAAQTIRQGQTPRTIDVQALQTRLARLGVLPAQVLHRPLEPLHYTDA